MKKINLKIKLAMVFIVLTCLVYLFHYLMFRDSIYIFKTAIVQLGFLPLSTLLVTFVLNKLINHDKKQELMQKLNMVIGCFFSEMGTELIKIIKKEQLNTYEMETLFNFSEEWGEKEFRELKDKLRNESTEIFLGVEGIKRLREFLASKRGFMMNLLQNPNLLEHQSFTELLWAGFHLAEELIYRKNIDNLSERDFEHISKDISRLYSNLLIEWISYIEHLQKEYPFLYSFAVRTNPFNRKARVEIE